MKGGGGHSINLYLKELFKYFCDEMTLQNENSLALLICRNLTIVALIGYERVLQK